jgi:lipoprotein signal peptidase
MNLKVLLFGGALIAADQLAKGVYPGTTNEPRLPVLMSLAVLVVGCLLLYRSNNNTQRTGLTLVLAGGISNGIDYLRHGTVTDNLLFRSLETNAADIFIIIGVGILALSSVISRKIS